MSLWYLSCCGVLSEGGGTRTHDLGIKSPLLYQLSYAPLPKHLRPYLATQGSQSLLYVPLPVCEVTSCNSEMSYHRPQ